MALLGMLHSNCTNFQSPIIMEKRRRFSKIPLLLFKGLISNLHLIFAEETVKIKI